LFPQLPQVSHGFSSTWSITVLFALGVGVGAGVPVGVGRGVGAALAVLVTVFPPHDASTKQKVNTNRAA
jgi:hypothetical protein